MLESWQLLFMTLSLHFSVRMIIYAVYCKPDLVVITVVRVTASMLFERGKRAAAEFIVGE